MELEPHEYRVIREPGPPPGLVALVLVVVLAIVAATAAYAASASPRFALWRAAVAVQSRNWPLFTTYVDVQSIAESAVADITSTTTSTSVPGAGRAMQGLSAQAKPLVVKETQTLARQAVQSGTAARLVDSADKLMLSPRYVGIQRDGAEATATITAPKGGRLRLRLRRLGNRWRVVRVLDARELLAPLMMATGVKMMPQLGTQELDMTGRPSMDMSSQAPPPRQKGKIRAPSPVVVKPAPQPPGFGTEAGMTGTGGMGMLGSGSSSMPSTKGPSMSFTDTTSGP